MKTQFQFGLLWLIPVICFIAIAAAPSSACCPAGPLSSVVVNADQSVIILWDPETKTEHFIRQASFKSDAADFAFLIPTPNEPELEESGNAAFPYLKEMTAPQVRHVYSRTSEPVGCGCSAPKASRAPAPSVTVLREKKVAGFNAQVLEATSATDLVAWLKEHEYAFSPEVETWVKPYIEQNWKITALKIAKKEGEQKDIELGAASLRLSFKTDRPLFPYREPDPTQAAAALGANKRLLQIFFVSDKRYEGELTKETPWTGVATWSNKLPNGARDHLLEHLGLPNSTGPKEFWLTEFQDNWPYRPAPADLYFSAREKQESFTPPVQTSYSQSNGPVDSTVLGFLVLAFTPWAYQRWRKRKI